MKRSAIAERAVPASDALPSNHTAQLTHRKRYAADVMH